MGWWRHRWRLALGVLVTATVIGVVGSFLLRVAVGAFVELLGLFLGAAVWLASALSSGADAWTIAGTVGRTVGNAFMSTEALALIGVLVLVSALALYALQRLLGFEEESSQ